MAKAFIARRHVPAAFLVAEAVVALCPWCLSPGMDPLAPEGEDPRLRWRGAEDERGGFERSLRCRICSRPFRIPKRAHIHTILKVGALPLFPSWLKNRAARGQFAEEATIGDAARGFTKKQNLKYKRIGRYARSKDVERA